MINLNELTHQEIQSLARLKQIGGDSVIKVLEKFVAAEKDSLVAADEMAIIHRLQGRVQAYRNLIEAVDEAVKLDARSNRV